jgi:tripartite-type tricarboxylate transporter receptor subunit TctC
MRHILAAALGVSLVAAMGAVAPASAQSQWPTRTVKIITPQPPGSGIDLSCRLYGEKLSQRWGQAVVVENRVGGDGAIGVGAFVSAADDHALLCSFGAPITILPFTSQSKLPYDPATDLKPISPIVDLVQVFAVSQSMGVDNVGALMKAARAEPGKLNWSATQGVPILLMSSFLRGAGLDLAYVPYSTLAPALQDLAQSRIQLFATSYASLSPVLESNQARIILVLNRERAPQAPDVPTAAEAGLPHLTIVSFNGFFGGRSMPEDVRERVAREIQAIGAEPDVAPRLQKLGMAVRTSSPAAFTQVIEEQRATVQSILKATGGMPGQK